MEKIKYKGEILSFWQLLNKQSIEIPIIQRDYAQGREDKEELRGNFLSALHESLANSSFIKLDFIYGSYEAGAFQPLDGQQRLTTLFLLHWYAALKNNILNNENAEILTRFSYETRASSREFCKNLINNSTNLDLKSDRISPQIIDSSWFFLSWKKDPTIDAMLRTIDDIHLRFSSIENLWDKLISEKLITFYHVVLKDIGLTDDLYIKMNARGKLLSSFENFKASFQKYIKKNEWEKNIDFQNTFACKIDTIWTDLFWNHRKDDLIDEAFMRFISAIVMIQQALEKKSDRINIISKIQRNPSSIKVDNFSKSTFEYLCKCLDVYHLAYNNKYETGLNFPLWQHKPENNIFSALVYEDNYSSPQRNSASYTQKALFYAQTEYLLKVPEFNKDNFLSWMRVIRNIVCRGDVEKNGNRPAIIRSPETFDGVISLISELSEGCENIYSFLAEKETLKSSFAKEQIEEERIKAKLINADTYNKSLIFETEDLNLLQGKIEFVLKCIEYKSDIVSFDSGKLEKVKDIIANYLNEENHINNDLRRALLTIHDSEEKYKFYEYWWSYSYVVDANKRCLIERFRELEYYIYGNYKNRDYFRLYLKDLILQLFDSNLKDIAGNFIPPNYMPNWQIRLIKEPKLLDNKCKSKYIAIPQDESCCFLLRSMRPRDIDGCEKIS